MKVSSHILDEDSLDFLDNLYDKDLDFNISENVLVNTDFDNFNLSVEAIY